MKSAGKWKISKLNKMKSCPSILSNRERNKLSNGERKKLETCLIKWLNSLSLAFIHSLLWPGWAEKLKCQLYSDISCQDAKIARGQCTWNPNHNKHMQGRLTHTPPTVHWDSLAGKPVCPPMSKWRRLRHWKRSPLETAEGLIINTPSNRKFELFSCDKNLCLTFLFLWSG